nr:monovalent cation/H(+) antiporter subunit G [Streptomyces sp. 891-h]
MLLPSGAAFCLLGALGLLRFADIGSRLHAAAKAQTLGVLLILVGTSVQMPLHYALVLPLVALFQLFTTRSPARSSAAPPTAPAGSSTVSCSRTNSPTVSHRTAPSWTRRTGRRHKRTTRSGSLDRALSKCSSASATGRLSGWSAAPTCTGPFYCTGTTPSPPR